MNAPESPNRIERFVGQGGLPALRLVHSSGYSATVSEYGGHVLSWCSPSEQEFLFVSTRAVYEIGKPIRGGIPVVFPQFGKGDLPQHGFARVKRWKVVREQVSTNDAVSVTLRLSSDSSTDSVWPHPFTLELDVVLTDVLLTTLRVINTGRGEFAFTSALHTYFRTSDVSKVRIEGLRDVEYVDFLLDRKNFVEQRSSIAITEPIDRAYRDSPETLWLSCPEDNVRLAITKEGFRDTVVWNPWIEGAKKIGDLAPEEYPHMLCIESANVLSPVTLEAGDVYTSAQIFRAETPLSV